MELTAYGACGLSKYARPAHECPRQSKIGAFFESNRDLTYTVCITFPSQRRICAIEQSALANTLYVNKVTSNALGRHKLVWYTAGRKLVRYLWRY